MTVTGTKTVLVTVGGVCTQNTYPDGCSTSFEINAGSGVTPASINHSFTNTFSETNVGTNFAGTHFPGVPTGGNIYTITPLYATVTGGGNVCLFEHYCPGY